MRQIIIKNFRCYEEKVIRFRRGINLLIGDNSVGKTSLLRVCNLVMNAFFSGYSDENTVWKSADDDDFREIKSEDVVDNDLPINITFDLDKEDLPDIVLEGGKKVCLQTNEPEVEEGCARFYIEKKSKKNARNLVTGLKNLKAFSSMLQKSSHTINNGVAINVNSKNPERAMMVLNEFYTNPTINDMTRFGIEGKHWEAVGDDQYKIIDESNFGVDSNCNWGWMNEVFKAKRAEYATNEHYCKMIQDFRNGVSELKAHLESTRPEGDVQKIMLFSRLDADVAVLKTITAEVEAAYPDVKVTSSTWNNLEINAKTAHKGVALKRFAESLGLTLANCISFGDGGNDLTMIEAAGVGVAMANAAPEVLAAADYVSCSNDEDGVAKALEHFGLA